MPRVSFTRSLDRHVACPPELVTGDTVRGALDAYFARHPPARSYILDEQAALRRHVTVFVDGTQVRDRSLSEPVGPNAQIFVMQALSGG
jgi:hypothetical protein